MEKCETRLPNWKSQYVFGTNFLWQGSEDKKFHLSQVGGTDSEQDIRQSGDQKLEKTKQSLMMKWLWKFAWCGGQLGSNGQCYTKGESG